MSQTLEMLVILQGQILDYRRFAAGIGDPEAAQILYRLADELEHYARETDRESISPERSR
jgi:hypothetical protein